MDRWLCCDVTVAGRQVKLCVRADQVVDAEQVQVAIPAPDVEAEVHVLLPRARFEAIATLPVRGVIVGRLVDPSDPDPTTG